MYLCLVLIVVEKFIIPGFTPPPPPNIITIFTQNSKLWSLWLMVVWNNLFWRIEIVLTIWNIYTKSSVTCMASVEVFICEHLLSWFNYVEYNTFISFNDSTSSEFPLQSVLLSCFWLYMNIVYFSIVSAVLSASQKITQHSIYFLAFFSIELWHGAVVPVAILWDQSWISSICTNLQLLPLIKSTVLYVTCGLSFMTGEVIVNLC